MKRYWALIENDIVGQVIVAQESPGDDWVETWKDGGQRGNYAGQGMVYDPDLDAFYGPQAFPSWILNTETFRWEPPIPYPAEPALNEYGYPALYVWDESVGEWVVSE